MTDWTPTGSRVSGNGYGYDLLLNGDALELGAQYAVLLTVGGPFIAPTNRSAVAAPGGGFYGSFYEASRIGEAFCHCWRAWQTVQRRERALSQGLAVLG